MSANATKANLIDALKQLRARWSHIKMIWQDEAALKFEQDVIDPLEPAILSAARGVEHVGELIAQVHRECGDDHRD